MASRVVVAVREGARALVDALSARGLEARTCAPESAAETCASLDAAACLWELGREADLESLSSFVSCGTVVIAVVPSDRPGWAQAAIEGGVRAVLPAPAAANWALAAVERGLLESGWLLERNEARAQLDREDELVFQGDSAAVRRLREDVERVAASPDATVLVHGERGVGKLAVARTLHARSGRSRAACLRVRGAELQDGVGALSLFGEPTSGRRGRLGRIEGGTLILSDVDHLGEAAQGALVRFLTDREQAADVRLVATTERDLQGEVEAGRMREDLAYRLNVLTLRVPSLADRGQDIPTLVRGIFGRCATSMGRPWVRLGDGVPHALAGEPWPGNLAELQLHIRKLVLVNSGSILGPDAPEASFEAGGKGLSTIEPALPLRGLRLADAEEALIRRVLEETGGNKLRAAEILGIHRTTLYHKLKGLGIS